MIDCPLIQQIGNVGQSCSTDQLNLELRKMYFVQFIDFKQQQQRYLVVFGLNGVSFYNPLNLQLVSYKQLAIQSVQYFQDQKNGQIYYLDVQGFVYLLNTSTYSFVQAAQISLNSISTVIISTDITYYIYQNQNGQLIFNDMTIQKEIIITNDANNYIIDSSNNYIIITQNSQNYLMLLDVKNQFQKTLVKEIQSPFCFYSQDNFIVAYAQNQLTSVYELIFYQIDLKQVVNKQSIPNQNTWDSFWINGVAVQLNENNEKIIILYGSQFFLMVVNTVRWTAQIMQQSLSQQQLQQIDYKDSQFLNSNLNSDKINYNLLNAAYNNGVIVTSSTNLIAAYDFEQQKFLMLKFQQDYYNNINNGNQLANIIFINENIFYIMNTKALQMIDINQSKIKFDTKCFIVEQILSNMSSFIYTDNDLDRLYLFDQWGINKIYLGRIDQVQPFYELDYSNNQLLRTVQPVWADKIVNFITNTQFQYLIFTDYSNNLYIQDILTLKILKQYSFQKSSSNFKFVAQQDSNYVLYYNQTLITIINLNDLSQVLLNLKNVSSSSFLLNQNELINYTTIDLVNDLLYFITSSSNIYKFKQSNLVFQGIIFQQNTKSNSITFTRIQSQQQIWISTSLFIIQLQEQYNNQIGISLQFSSDNSIIFYGYDTINSISNNNVTIIILSSKGTLYHYQGNNIVLTQQIYYQTTIQGFFMDTINMCALSYSLDGNIINYNYKKKVIQMQWQSNQSINQIKIDQTANKLIYVTIMSTLYVKSYLANQFYAQNQDNQGFNGGVTDVSKNTIIAYNQLINFYSYPNLNFIQSYQHNPLQTNNFSNIVNLQLISEIDTIISYSSDGSISIFQYSTMNYIKTVQFDQNYCDYPIGGSYYQSKVQFFIRCNGGSIYLLDAQNYSFKIIQAFNHILNVWKVTQILVVEQLDKVYFVGYCYWVQEYKLSTLTFNQLHQGVDGRYDYYNNVLLLFDQNGQIYIFDSLRNAMIRFQVIHVSWIYDLAINYQNQQFVSCGIDGTLQLQLYNMTDLSKRIIYTHYQSWKSLLYDQEANILTAFDIEGNIFLFNFNTLQLRKKILKFSGQILNPYIDFSTNMLVSYSTVQNGIFILDYDQMITDHSLFYSQDNVSVQSTKLDLTNQNMYIIRQDLIVNKWNLISNQISYLFLIQEYSAVNSHIYYFGSQNLIIVTTPYTIYVYDEELEQILEKIQFSCTNSLELQNQIFCINNQEMISLTIIAPSTTGQSSYQKYLKAIQSQKIPGNIDKFDFNDNLFVLSVLENNQILIYIRETQQFIIQSNLTHKNRTKQLNISENNDYILIISEDQIIQILYGQNFNMNYSLQLPQVGLQINHIYYSNQDFIFIKQQNLLQLIQINSVNQSSYTLNLTQNQMISCSGKSNTISFNRTVFLFCQNNQVYYINVNKTQGIFTIIQQQRNLMNFVFRNPKSYFLTSNIILSISYNSQQLYVVRDNHFDIIGQSTYISPKSTQFINNFSFQDDSIFHLKMIFVSNNVLQLINASIILTDDISNHNKNTECQTQIQYISEIEFQNQCTTQIIGQDDQNLVTVELTTFFIENMLQMQGLTFQNLNLKFQQNTSDVQTFYMLNNLQYLGMSNILLNSMTNLYLNISDILKVDLQNIQIVNQQLNFIYYPIIFFQNITSLNIQNLNVSNCYLNSQQESSIIFINQSKNVSLEQINIFQNQFNITFFFYLNEVQSTSVINSNVSRNYPLNLFAKSKNLQNLYDVPSQFISMSLINYCFIDNIYFQYNQQLVFFSYFNFQEFLLQGVIDATYTLLDDIFIAQNLFIINNYNIYSLIYLKSKNSTFQGILIQNNTIENNNLVKFDNSLVTLKDSLISENKALQQSQFYSLSSNLMILNTVFSSNSQKYSVLYLSQSYTVILKSNFTSNLSLNDGACIYVDNQDFIINSNTTFFLGDSLYLSKNQAQGSGGAILFNCINCIVQNSVFELNSAVIGGGFRYIRVIPTFLNLKDHMNLDSCGTFNNNNCLKNTAYFYGNNFASYPKYIDFIFYNNTLNSSQIILTNMRSGQDKINITVLMRDENQQVLFLQQGDFQKSPNIINEIQSFKAKLQTISQSETEIKIDGSTIAEFSNNEFQFSQLTTSGIPGTKQRLTLVVTGIFSLQNQTHFDLSTAQNYSIQVQFRECQIGEIYTKLCNSCPIYQCSICELGTYSLVQPIKDSNQNCLQCDYTSSISCQQNQIQIKKGFWRLSNSSNVIEQCVNSVQNCNGDETTNYCEQGYIGPLCEVCDNHGKFWGSKYGKSFLNNYQCLKCYNIDDSLYIFIFSLIIIFYSTYTIWKLVNQSNVRIICYYMMKLNILRMGKTAVVGETTLYFKQFIHQLQVLFCLQNLSLEFGSLFEVSNKFVIPLSTNIHSLDCFLSEISSQVPMYVTRLIWATIVPFILYFITILVYYIIAKLKRQKDQGQHSFSIQHKYFTKTAGIFFIFIMQQGIIDSLIQIISCRQIGEKYYIQFQISEECYTDEHKKVLYYFAIPLLFSWVLFLPMVIFIILFLKRDRRNSSFYNNDQQNNQIQHMSDYTINQNTDFKFIGQRALALSSLNQSTISQNKKFGNCQFEKCQQYNLNQQDTIIDDKFLEESDKSGIFTFDESQNKISQVKDSVVGPYQKRTLGKASFDIQSPLTPNQLLLLNKNSPEKIKLSQESSID
ncbi:hypothetical protein ABPG74_006537 [Tetrahymena malaccensis]